VSSLGISAVLQPSADLRSAVLDLAAVLEGLVGQRFEILLVGAQPSTLADLQARASHLPVRAIAGSVADACDAATFELILIAARDGQFDVRELNHLLEAIERGADIAAGYRPRPTDPLVWRFQRWGWNVDVDCAFALMRRCVWERLRSVSCGAARRLGYRVSEVPVSHRRPTLGAPVAA
jgi:hypothetical protein